MTVKKILTKEEKRNRAISVSVGIIVAALVSHQFATNTGYSDKALIAEARQTNEWLKKHPAEAEVKDILRIDSFSVPESKVFVEHITAYVTKDEANNDTIKKYINPGLLNNIKTNPQLKVARKYGITFVHLFNDINGEVFYTYTVTPDMYK